MGSENYDFIARAEPVAAGVADPVTARIAAEAETECLAIWETAARTAATARWKLSAADARLEGAAEELEKAEAEAAELPPPEARTVPSWVSPPAYAALLLAEFWSHHTLLKYSGLRSSAGREMPLSERFAGGFVDGVMNAAAYYWPPMFWMALGLSVAAVFGAKLAGTWFVRRGSVFSRKLTWAVVAFNAVYLAAVASFVAIRYADFSLHPESPLGGYPALAILFFPIQAVLYAASFLLSAFMSDPDPAATASRKRAERAASRFEALLDERGSLSGAVTAAVEGARVRAAGTVARAEANAAAYRAANLRARPRGSVPPAFLTNPPLLRDCVEPPCIESAPDLPPGASRVLGRRLALIECRTGTVRESYRYGANDAARKPESKRERRTK